MTTGDAPLTVATRLGTLMEGPRRRIGDGLDPGGAMVTLAVRLVPEHRQDLGWVRRCVDDVHDLYAFLLTVSAEDSLSTPPRTMSPEEHRRAVDGIVAQTGMPSLRMGGGSLILELSQLVEATAGVQALVAFGLLLKRGPEVAAWPGRVREAWYSSRTDALRAREAYERLSSEGRVSVVEEDEPAVAENPLPPDGPGRSAPRVPRPRRAAAARSDLSAP